MTIENIQLRYRKIQVERKLTTCLQLVGQYFNHTFTRPTISYRLRGTKAGVAYLRQNEMRLNQTLLLENPKEFIFQVVPHEFAHLIVYQVFGRVKPHGKEWQMLMQHVFGLPTNIYHQFDIKNVQSKIFIYHCLCQTHQLSLRRHNKIQREEAAYFCRQCKGVLLLSDE